MGKQAKLDWSQVTGMASVIIAVAALVLSVYEFNAARRHDTLSVRPVVGFQLVGAPVEGWPQAGLHIVNYGTGLAEIKQLTVYVDHKPVEAVGESSGLEQAVELLGLGGRPDMQITYAVSLVKALPAGQTRVLIGMERDAYSSERGAVLNSALKRVEMRVRYESLYHEVFETAFAQP